MPGPARATWAPGRRHHGDDGDFVFEPGIDPLLASTGVAGIASYDPRVGTDAEDAAVRGRVETALASVIDPEVGLDVLALGLVYGIEIDDEAVRIDLTMTTPACPLGEKIVADAERAIRGQIPGRAVAVRLVWEPPWSPERMSESARQALGW